MSASLFESNGRWVLEGRELHCGDCFQVRDRVTNKWIDVRIELDGHSDWYLVGLPDYLRDRYLWNFEARRYSVEPRRYM